MWTHLLLTAHPVWDDLHWRVDATWLEDLASEPVHLTKSGVAPCHGLDEPIDLLAACLAALRAERTRERRQEIRTAEG
jgi:hypothetical protein